MYQGVRPDEMEVAGVDDPRPVEYQVVHIVGHAVLPPRSLELGLEHRIVRKAQINAGLSMNSSS